MRTLALVTVAALASGCATGRTIELLSAAKLQFDASQYPDDPAVVLFRSDRTELYASATDPWTEYERHEAIAVLTEAAFELAEVRVPVWPKSELRHFHARVVQPDGTEQTWDGARLLGESSAKGERDINMRFFRFPDVRVGSVLEYSWSVRGEWIAFADEQEPLGPFPVRHYEFDLVATKSLKMETIEFNGGAPIHLWDLDNSRNQFHFELENLPQRREADYAPHWTFTEPRWAWRVKAFQGRYERRNLLANWSDVIEGRARAFFVDGKLEQDLVVPLVLKDCPDVRCAVDRAMGLLAENTTTSGVKWNREAKLSAALESGQTSVVERALLLKTMLERAGVEVWLGYGTELFSQPISTFPRLAQFNHLFVHLPAQEGLGQAVTIDASCDYCEFGQLPESFRGTQIYVFKTKPFLDEVNTEGRWVSASQEAPISSRYDVTHQARLLRNGTINDEVSVRASGNGAEEFRQRKRNWNPTRVHDFEEELLEQVSPEARVESVRWGECTRWRCGWDVTASLSSEARVDGPRLLVPTTVFRPLWERGFESPTRMLDVHFREPEQVEERYELKVPGDLELAEVPKPVSLRLNGLWVEVKFEKTPDGVLAVRTLKNDVTAIAKEDYTRLRDAIEAFRRARRQVLVFAPKKGVSTRTE